MPEKLAIDGGHPVRTEPWPPMYPGGLVYGEEEARAVAEVARARSPFRHYGINLLHKVDEFEKAYAEFVGVRYALAVGSGSTALTVALAALGVGPGTEVILPAFMWISDVNSVVWLRAVPVIAEVDDTLNLDPDDLGKKITPRTKAIVAVHMAGSAADMAPILEVADRHGVPVLEDCSQAAGTSISGKLVGSLGAVAVASLQYNKNFTSGEGGVITTNKEEIYRRCSCFSDVGFERDVDGVSKPLGSPFESFGIGTRMDEFRGAAALEQLKKLSHICSAMRRHHRNVWNAVKDIPGLIPRRLVDPEGDSGAYLFWFHKSKDLANRFILALSAEGIPAQPPHGGIHQYRFMVNLLNQTHVTTKGCPWSCPYNQGSPMDYRPDDTPRSNDLLDRAVMIPMPPTLADEDEKHASMAIRKVASALLAE